MNNAFIIQETLGEEIAKDPTPELRQRAEQLMDIIEALQHIGASEYWNVLKQFVFDVDLDKAKRSLAKEKDTTEMFRLQGEIRNGEKLDIPSLLDRYRNELKVIQNQL